VTVTIGRRDDRAVIQVADTGPGIPADELPLVFQRFFRSTRIRNQVSGTGLGLAITKAIIDAHHGDIAVESEPGRGTRVSITLDTATQAGATVGAGAG
jgi:two-component system sensor histidine kinase BaeS